MSHLTPTRRRSRSPRRLVALAVAAGLASSVGAACSDDDPTSAATCDAFATMSTLDAQAPRDPAELPAYAKDVALPVARSITSGLPDDLVDDGKVIEEAFAAMAETGDFEAVMRPEVDAAKASIGKHLYASCSGKAVTVDAVDYGFAGLPEKLPAGAVNVRFTNTGTEEHEMLVLRRNDGVQGSLEELTKNPEEMMGNVKMIGVVYGAPDDVRYSRFELDRGTYFFICMVPTKGVESDPHLNHGMHRQVTVA